MKFADLGLRPEILRAVDRAGYETATPIQERAIPAVLDGQDLIACAQTGTGKTAAFLLPILQRLGGSRPCRAPRALVVTPTRELAAQITEAARQYGCYLRLRSTVIFGGVGMEPQERRLRGGLDLLVATPGRLLDHLGRGHARLDRIETLVLDEADRMLDMGFLPDIRRILKALPETRQNLFFSATMPDEIERLIRRTATNPTVIEVTRRATPVGAIRQVVHPVAMTSKKDLLKTLLESADMGPTLVFTRTKARANQLVRRLETSPPAGCRNPWQQESERTDPRARRLPRRQDRHADCHRHRGARYRRRGNQSRRQLRSPARPRRLRAPHRPHRAGRGERACGHAGGARGAAATGCDRATGRELDPTRDGGGVRSDARHASTLAPSPAAPPEAAQPATWGRARPRRGARQGGGARPSAPAPRSLIPDQRGRPRSPHDRRWRRYSSKWISAIAIPLSPATAYSRKTRPLAASSKIAGSRSWLTCP